MTHASVADHPTIAFPIFFFFFFVRHTYLRSTANEEDANNRYCFVRVLSGSSQAEIVSSVWNFLPANLWSWSERHRSVDIKENIAWARDDNMSIKNALKSSTWMLQTLKFVLRTAAGKLCFESDWEITNLVSKFNAAVSQNRQIRRPVSEIVLSHSRGKKLSCQPMAHRNEDWYNTRAEKASWRGWIMWKGWKSPRKTDQILTWI